MATATADTITRSINAIYEGFGKGDIAAITAELDEQVDWDFAYATDNPIPWLRRGRGRAHAAKFFETLGSQLEIHAFGIDHVLTGENIAVVLFSIECTVRATGKRVVEQEEAHIWHFNDAGKVVRFRHAADSLQQYLALQR